jgi:uncharacterized protein
MSGTVELPTLLATMEPELSDDGMVFCSFPDATVEDKHFPCPSGFFKERERVTLLIRKSDAERHGIPFHTVLQAVTHNVHSGLEAVGFTAAVTNRLARHGISANIVATYYHDHILVPVPNAERTLQVLRSLQAEVRHSLHTERIRVWVSSRRQSH